jgi:hypothetical protein
MYISSFACYSKNNVFWTYQPLINEKYKRENSTTPSGLDEFRNTCGKKYDPATKQQSTNSSQYRFPVSETSLLQKRNQKRSNMEVILSCCCCLLSFVVEIELGTFMGHNDKSASAKIQLAIKTHATLQALLCSLHDLCLLSSGEVFR